MLRQQAISHHIALQHCSSASLRAPPVSIAACTSLLLSVYLKESEVGRPSDVPHDAGGALNAHIQQRGRDGSQGRISRSALARGSALPHQRGACTRDDGAHVCKVHIDQPWHLQTCCTSSAGLQQLAVCLHAATSWHDRLHDITPQLMTMTDGQ